MVPGTEVLPELRRKDGGKENRMKIIKASAEILSPTITNMDEINDMFQRMELAGRTCYKSNDKITPASARKFVEKLVRSHHEAMLEHASMTVRFVVDRGVSHELVRHRIASFAQESTRYCVAGDSEITFNNPHVHMTIAELYQKVQSSTNGAWKRMLIRQYNEKTGELQHLKIKNVFYNGIKACAKMTTRLGYQITCTPDHEILTPNGYKRLEDLSIGDKVFVNGTDALYMNYDWLYNQNITLNKTFVQIAEEFGFNVNTIKKWARKLGIPKKGTGYFHIGHTPWNKGITDERQANALRKYHHCGRRKDKILKDDTKKYHKHKGTDCHICGAKENLEVHHIDKNHDNNNPDNLMTVCESCHQRVHSQNLLVAYADEIMNIEAIGLKEVYDIEMDSEYHNYIANGIVVHNCNYSKDKFRNELTFIEPCFWKDKEHDLEMKAWKETMKGAEDLYMAFMEYNIPPQEARCILPNSLKTEVIMTANMREWRHFFRLRAAGVTGAPHPQMLEVAVPLYQECVKAMPELFCDIAVPTDVLKKYGKEMAK
jgi:thymidylate synthase ThyX